jgi:hypothetical protein
MLGWGQGPARAKVGRQTVERHTPVGLIELRHQATQDLTRNDSSKPGRRLGVVDSTRIGLG